MHWVAYRAGWRYVVRLPWAGAAIADSARGNEPMSEDRSARRPEPVPPLESPHPFAPPGEPIELYNGLVSGVAEGPRGGVIRMICRGRKGVRWKVFPESGDWSVELGVQEAVLDVRGRAVKVDLHRKTRFDGWVNAVSFGDSNGSASRLVVQWMNLPEILGQIPLKLENGGMRLWMGRWHIELDDWTITLDSRPDLGKMIEAAEADEMHVLTHVMEIRGKGGRDFDCNRAIALLECLRVTFSFAFGRWV